MKKNKAVFTVLITIGLIIFSNKSVYSEGEYHVVQEHSAVAFEGRNLKGEVVHGEFTEFSGEVFLDKHNLETFETNFKVRAASVVTSNIEKDAQLQGEECFDVVKQVLLAKNS